MKMKNELPQVGFEPTTLCTPDRCSYPCTHVCEKHYIEDNTPEQLTVWLSTMEYPRPSHMCKVSKDTCIRESITLNHD